MTKIVFISAVVCGLFVSLPSAVALGTAFTYHRLTAKGSPFPDPRLDQKAGSVAKAERLGDLLKFHHRQADNA